MTNATVFKNTTFAKLFISVLAVTALVLTGIGYFAFLVFGDEAATDTSISTATTVEPTNECTSKSSTTVHMGEVVNVKGTNVWFNTGEGKTIVHYDGLEKPAFTTIVGTPPGSPTIARTVASLVAYDVPDDKTGVVEISTISPYGYTASVTVC